jgi:hypothetical protein
VSVCCDAVVGLTGKKPGRNERFAATKYLLSKLVVSEVDPLISKTDRALVREVTSNVCPDPTLGADQIDRVV